MSPDPSPERPSPDFRGAGVFAPVQFLKGIGPRKSAVLEKAGVRTIFDLLLYVPRRYLDRSAIMTIAGVRSAWSDLSLPGPGDADVRRYVTVVGEVRSFQVAGFGRKARFVLVLADETGSLQCVWFGGVQYWKNAFRIGEILAVSGEPSYYNNVLQFVHPALDRLGGKGEGEEVDWGTTLHTGGLVPLYPSGQSLERIGFDSAGFRRAIGASLRSHLGQIPETLPEALRRHRRLLPLADAIRFVHFPPTREDLAASLYRLKYEELFYFQLRLALRRHHIKNDPEGIGFEIRSRLARQLVDSLPFSLTRAQVRVINEITADMSSPKPMNRLLQGDVGSGKTIVALLSMLIAVDNGFQAVLMAPTEILAEQHYRTLAALLHGVDVNTRFLVGGQRSRLRRDVLEDVQRGSAQILVGTHALFERQVEFARLGLVVIDEQHRFGVLQRTSLLGKGRNPDVLVMTATPIPRTLSLTLYGDLDVSVIDEMPGNRKPIKTTIRYADDKKLVYDFVRQQVRQGRQAYFVYPVIEESDKPDVRAATVHFEELRTGVFPDLRLRLLHGRLPGEEKEEIMQSFQRGEVDVLVATTVIEVGIDVPNASVMVIENAERFGLSQLHQLRGRVGRGADQSYCLLLAQRWVARKAKSLAGQDADRSAEIEARLAERRLATMVQTTDGFRIAEVDLQLRGPGDFFGTRQSGVPAFRVADILQDTELLDVARRDAFSIVEQDPLLRQEEHGVLAEHLRRQYSDSLSLLDAG
jgi:ATP-dependent DNA helicase RecG